MKKTIKWAGISIAIITALIVAAGMYKFNYLSNLEGYDVDGNKIENIVEEKEIKALSPDDIEGLLMGDETPFGGMAKPAELNGYPGPLHVLNAFEAGKFDLTNEQYIQIEALHEEMKTHAINLGKQIIDIENEIDKMFVNKTITEDWLERAVAESSDAYSKLRVVHLKYHLKMAGILSEEQIVKYNQLYGQ